jgi:hypothetical protein
MRPAPSIIATRRKRDVPDELVGISRRDDAVGFAPDDQGRRGDAVNVIFPVSKTDHDFT